MLYRFVLPIALLAAIPVYAQTAPDSGYEVPGQAPGQARARGGEMRERLQQVHDRLGITPAQQPQWDAVVAALRENAQAMRANPAARAVRSGTLNTLQELHAAADLAHARADALQRLIPPVEALYTSLSAEQQRTADQTLAQVMHAAPAHRG